MYGSKHSCIKTEISPETHRLRRFLISEPVDVYIIVVKPVNGKLAKMMERRKRLGTLSDIRSTQEKDSERGRKRKKIKYEISRKENLYMRKYIHILYTFSNDLFAFLYYYNKVLYFEIYLILSYRSFCSVRSFGDNVLDKSFGRPP